MHSLGIFAGSFDPIHYGHLNLIERSLGICNKLIIAIGNNSNKKTLLSLQERKELIKDQLETLPIALQVQIEIKSYEGLLASFAKENNASLLIRGVRTAADFEYETQLAMFNKKLNPSIETILLPTEQELSLFSSSAIKELIRYNETNSLLNNMVSVKVLEKLSEKVKKF